MTVEITTSSHADSSSSTTTMLNDEGESVEVPDEFLCPISLSIMTRPLMNRQGRNYERDAILAWLHKSDTCPLTRQPLRPSDLVPNKHLEMTIRFWCINHRVDCKKNEASYASADLSFVGFMSFPDKQQQQPEMPVVVGHPAYGPTPEDASASGVADSQAVIRARVAHNHRRRLLSRILNEASQELDDF